MTQSKLALYLGEVLIGVVIRDDTRSEHVGGSPFSVACVIASLDRPALIGVWWGRDDHGKLIEDYAANHGVEIMPNSDGAIKTSLVHTHLNDTGSTEYEFDLSWEVPPLPAPEVTTYLHTGSLAATLEPDGTQVLKAACVTSQIDTVSYDPNARPVIMESPDKLHGCAGKLVALTDVVRVSDENLEWLYGRSAPVEEVIRQWLKLDPSLIIVTHGLWSTYIRLASTRDMLMIDPLTTDIVDTVGAGDSFMGDLISGLLDADLLDSRRAKNRLRPTGWSNTIPASHRVTTTSGLTVQYASAYAPTHEEVVAVKTKNLRLA